MADLHDTIVRLKSYAKTTRNVVLVRRKTIEEAVELLKEQQGISVDSFLKWCIESHMMGDATRNGIEYWINEFKAWKQKAKDGEQDAD